MVLFGLERIDHRRKGLAVYGPIMKQFDILERLLQVCPKFLGCGRIRLRLKMLTQTRYIYQASLLHTCQFSVQKQIKERVGSFGLSHKRKLVYTLVSLWPMWCVPINFVYTMESPQLLSTT
jgi:hypothetical protein